MERVWKETTWPELSYHLAVPRLEPVISRIVISMFSASMSLLSRRIKKSKTTTRSSTAAAAARIIMDIMIVVVMMLIRSRMAAR